MTHRGRSVREGALPDPPQRSALAEAMRYAQIGLMLVTTMVLCGGIGYALDRKFGSRPWLLLAGLLVGMAAGFVSFFRLVLADPAGGPDGRAR